eukprot:g1176.t1
MMNKGKPPGKMKGKKAPREILLRVKRKRADRPLETLAMSLLPPTKKKLRASSQSDVSMTSSASSILQKISAEALAEDYDGDIDANQNELHHDGIDDSRKTVVLFKRCIPTKRKRKRRNAEELEGTCGDHAYMGSHQLKLKETGAEDSSSTATQLTSSQMHHIKTKKPRSRPKLIDISSPTLRPTPTPMSSPRVKHHPNSKSNFKARFKKTETTETTENSDTIHGSADPNLALVPLHISSSSSLSKKKKHSETMETNDNDQNSHDHNNQNNQNDQDINNGEGTSSTGATIEDEEEFVYDLYRLTTIENYNEKLRQEIYRDAEIEYTSEILYFPEVRKHLLTDGTCQSDNHNEDSLSHHSGNGATREGAEAQYRNYHQYSDDVSIDGDFEGGNEDERRRHGGYDQRQGGHGQRRVIVTYDQAMLGHGEDENDYYTGAGLDEDSNDENYYGNEYPDEDDYSSENNDYDDGSSEESDEFEETYMNFD